MSAYYDQSAKGCSSSPESPIAMTELEGVLSNYQHNNEHLYDCVCRLSSIVNKLMPAEPEKGGEDSAKASEGTIGLFRDAESYYSQLIYTLDTQVSRLHSII